MAGMTEGQIVRLLKQRVSVAGSQAKAAEALGITQQYLGDIVGGRRKPGPKVLSALGLQRESRYTSIEAKP